MEKLEGVDGMREAAEWNALARGVLQLVENRWSDPKSTHNNYA